MKPVSPVIPNGNLQKYETKIAEHQNEYQPLPALILDGGESSLSRWELSEDEISEILRTKSIYLQVWTFGGKLQPVFLSASAPPLEIEKV